MKCDTNNKVVPFVTPDIAATEAVQKFVQHCRYELDAFGPDLDWDADNWDLTGYIAFRGRQNQLVRVRWSNYDSTKRKPGAQMQQPFVDFAKSYFRYQHSFNPTKAFRTRQYALRALERSLCEITDAPPRIENADASVFARAAQLIKGKYSKDTRYGIGAELERIGRFISDKRLTRTPFSWVNPLPYYTSSTIGIGKEYEEKRTKKLPTEDALQALARAYMMAREPRDILLTSIGVLLCSAPFRICEMLTIPVDCEHTDLSGNKERYALRSWPAKGAEPVVKWIVASMIGVAKGAIAKIRTITEPWRRVARWYEENPDKIYLPKEYEYLRQRKEASLEEIRGVLGLSSTRNAACWVVRNSLKSLRHPSTGSCALYAFSAVEEAILAKLPIGFPFIDQHTKLKYSEALFVVPRNFFCEKKSTCPAMIEPVSHVAITDGLGTRHAYASVFSRFDIVSESGEPIKIRTHQIRHFLNTAAQRGGASQTDIAMWSDRKNVSQNATYDHTTGDELIERVRQEDGGSITSDLKALAIMTPIVARSDLDTASTPAAHPTPVGFCTQDFARSPCQYFNDCINCSFAVFVKGNRVMEECARQEHSKAKELRDEAKKARGDSVDGADRWLEHQEITVAHYEELVAFYDDPNIPNGARMKLSPEKCYSPISEAVNNYLLDVLSSVNKHTLIGPIKP